LLDCGVHPGFDGIESLPFFDEVATDEIDLVLITHFHMDHAASLPYLTEKTHFKGKIFMTHPTKAVVKMLLADFLRVSNMSAEDQLYNEQDLQNCVEKIEAIDYHQVIIAKLLADRFCSRSSSLSRSESSKGSNSSGTVLATS
jgi:cleavage and polyadenylation specificity factor subunit 3